MVVPIVEKSLPLRIERPFYLNAFSTHNTLIIRALTDYAESEQVDVAFRPVSALKLSQTLNYLVVRRPTSDDLVTVSRDFGALATRYKDDRVFVIEGGPTVGYVLAGSMFLAVGQMPDGETSPHLWATRYPSEPAYPGPFYRFT